MTNRKSVALSVLVACVIFPSTVSPQLSRHQRGLPKVTVTVTPAIQESAPLEVVGFKLPQTAGREHPVAVFKNRSTKVPKSFWVAVMVRRADGAVAANDPVGFHGSGTLSWPNHEPEQQTILAAHWMAMRSSVLLSDCLHAAVAVYKVEFEDGSTWDLILGEDEAKKLWESSRNNHRPNACTHTPGIEETLRRVNNTGYSDHGAATKLDPRQVPSFSVTCPVYERGGRLSTLCPF